MRVITGSARGRRLISPENYDVRPTTDKVKESLFNILQFELEGRSFLDLFAGSGQIGIEALSRGAGSACFVDASKKSLDIVKKNLSITGFEKSSETVLGDANVFLTACTKKFDIIFLDPPYENGWIDKAFEHIAGVLKPTSVIVCESRTPEILPRQVADFYIDREYRYSAVKLTVYRCREEEI